MSLNFADVSTIAVVGFTEAEIPFSQPGDGTYRDIDWYKGNRDNPIAKFIGAAQVVLYYGELCDRGSSQCDSSTKGSLDIVTGTLTIFQTQPTFTTSTLIAAILTPVLIMKFCWQLRLQVMIPFAVPEETTRYSFADNKIDDVSKSLFPECDVMSDMTQCSEGEICQNNICHPGSVCLTFAGVGQTPRGDLSSNNVSSHTEILGVAALKSR